MKNLFAYALLLSVAATVSLAAVTVLTPEQFVEAQAAPHRRMPLFVRFYLPWDASGEPSTAAFARASEIVPPEVCDFAELRLDSLEAFVIADAHGITSFPFVKLFGTSVVRPVAPKGNQVVGRPTFVAKDYHGNATSADDLVEFVIRHTPTRVVDPVTNHITQAVLQITDESHVAALARVTPKTSKNGVLFYLPSIVRSDKKHGTALRHNLLLSAVHAQAAVHNQRVTVFTTQREDVAKAFGLSEHNTAAVFSIAAIANAAPNAKRPILRVEAGIETPAAAAKAIKDAAALDVAALEKEIGYTLRQWRVDMAQFAGKSPLRKLETTEEFHREVTDNKQGGVILFFLRESDKFFTKHHNVALDVASWSRGVPQVHPVTGEPVISNGFRFETFWVDAEVHSELAKKLSVKAVPSVGIVLSLQQQQEGGQKLPPKGIKFVLSPSKEFPDSRHVLSYINSAEVFEGRDIVPFDPAGAKLHDGGKTTQPQLLTPLNNAYLGVDLRSYEDDEPEADTFELGKKRATGDDDGDDSSAAASARKASGGSGAKEKNSAKEAAKRAKAEAEKQRLAEELARKKAEKEERIRKKAEEDKLRKEQEIAEAAKRREERKAGGGSDAPKKPAAASGEEKKVSDAERLAALRRAKAPKDRQAIRRGWAKEGADMAKKYVSVEGDKIVVSQKLDLP